MTLRRTDRSEQLLDTMVHLATHDGFADFDGDPGFAESFTDDLVVLIDKIIRLEDRADSLSLLRDVIDDLQAS